MEHAELFDHRYAQHRGLDAEVLEQVVTLALEIAREGREGRKIGTLFVIGDSESVLEHSKPLIYDPELDDHALLRDFVDGTLMACGAFARDINALAERLDNYLERRGGRRNGW